MNYGHIASMQVCGFELLHLDGLRRSSGVLFGHALERERLRILIRHALGARRSASVRVDVLAQDGDMSDPRHPMAPSVVVTVSNPQSLEPGHG
jgi:hypothetical protein